MADPGYPCNRNFTRFLEGQVVSIPVDASTDYQLTAQKIAEHWDDAVVGVLLASPSNPTGTLIPEPALRDIVSLAKQKGGVIFMDEIYHGLVYGAAAPSILQYTQDCFVINSFSKYFGMTGWRVGWLVAPREYVNAIDNFAQNIFLAAPTPAQHAALAAFEPASIAILEQRRDEFRARRDYLIPALRDIGFNIRTEPQGAFYIYTDCSRFSLDSLVFAETLLEEIGVAITPGNDFGEYRSEKHVRFAYTTSLERLQEGVARLSDYLA
jgi:aspartate/methionine/tyrosine aminotransferase